MKQVVNIIITGFIIWAAGHFFPNYVQVSGILAIILTTLLISAVAIPTFLFFIFFIIKTLEAAAEINMGAKLVVLVCFGFFLSVFIAILIAVCIASGVIPGFRVIGFAPKLILTLAIAIIRIPEKTNNNA